MAGITASMKYKVSDPKKAHFVIQTDRLGSSLFPVKLEYEHYRPRSGRNKLLDFDVMNWPYVGNQPMLMWFVVSIPKEDYHLAEQVAKECGLEIINDVTVVLHEGKAEEFPLQGDNVYTLKNNTSSVQYKNDGETIEKQKAAEKKMCEDIINADELRMRHEYRQGGYSDEQIDRMLARWKEGDGDYHELPGQMTDGSHRIKRD